MQIENRKTITFDRTVEDSDISRYSTIICENEYFISVFGHSNRGSIYRYIFYSVFVAVFSFMFMVFKTLISSIKRKLTSEETSMISVNHVVSSVFGFVYDFITGIFSEHYIVACLVQLIMLCVIHFVMKIINWICQKIHDRFPSLSLRRFLISCGNVVVNMVHRFGSILIFYLLAYFFLEDVQSAMDDLREYDYLIVSGIVVFFVTSLNLSYLNRLIITMTSVILFYKSTIFKSTIRLFIDNIFMKDDHILKNCLIRVACFAFVIFVGFIGRKIRYHYGFSNSPILWALILILILTIFSRCFNSIFGIYFFLFIALLCYERLCNIQLLFLWIICQLVISIFSLGIAGLCKEILFFMETEFSLKFFAIRWAIVMIFVIIQYFFDINLYDSIVKISGKISVFRTVLLRMSLFSLVVFVINFVISIVSHSVLYSVFSSFLYSLIVGINSDSFEYRKIVVVVIMILALLLIKTSLSFISLSQTKIIFILVILIVYMMIGLPLIMFLMIFSEVHVEFNIKLTGIEAPHDRVCLEYDNIISSVNITHEIAEVEFYIRVNVPKDSMAEKLHPNGFTLFHNFNRNFSKETKFTIKFGLKNSTIVMAYSVMYISTFNVNREITCKNSSLVQELNKLIKNYLSIYVTDQDKTFFDCPIII